MQRTWSSYLRAALIRRFENVDVYKKPARIILFVTAGLLRRDGPLPTLYGARTPTVRDLLRESI